MKPATDIDAPRRLPGEFLPFEPPRAVRASLVPGAEVDAAPPTGALLRFRSLMAAIGQPVQLARLCADRHYACERIAAAHASGNAELRRVALELFQIHHRHAGGLPAQ